MFKFRDFKVWRLLLGFTSLLTMATMKKITKPASTTIAVFVTCIEILWRDKKSNSSATRESGQPVYVLVEGALLLVHRGGEGASYEKRNDA